MSESQSFSRVRRLVVYQPAVAMRVVAVWQDDQGPDTEELPVLGIQAVACDIWERPGVRGGKRYPAGPGAAALRREGFTFFHESSEGVEHDLIVWDTQGEQPITLSDARRLWSFAEIIVAPAAMPPGWWEKQIGFAVERLKAEALKPKVATG